MPAPLIDPQHLLSTFFVSLTLSPCELLCERNSSDAMEHNRQADDPGDDLQQHKTRRKMRICNAAEMFGFMHSFGTAATSACSDVCIAQKE